jgi:hypothetical protein
MNIKKTFWIIAMILIILPSVLSADKNDYVSMLNNTPSCIDNCYTIYSIQNPSTESITLNWSNAWWSWRTDEDGTLRDSSYVSDLKYWNVQVEDSRDVQVWAEDMVCNPYNVTDYNGTRTESNCTDEGEYVTEQQNYWRGLQPFDVDLSPGKSVKILEVSLSVRQ